MTSQRTHVAPFQVMYLAWPSLFSPKSNTLFYLKKYFPKVVTFPWWIPHDKSFATPRFKAYLLTGLGYSVSPPASPWLFAAGIMGSARRLTVRGHTDPVCQHNFAAVNLGRLLPSRSRRLSWEMLAARREQPNSTRRGRWRAKLPRERAAHFHQKRLNESRRVEMDLFLSFFRWLCTSFRCTLCNDSKVQFKDVLLLVEHSFVYFWVSGPWLDHQTSIVSLLLNFHSP